MGQRSQIYVRGTERWKDERFFIARYYQWNYGERMISRARGGIEWIKARTCISQFDLPALKLIWDVNWDMHDMVISTDLIEEYERYGKDYGTLGEYVFSADNNDGRLFVDIVSDGEKTTDIKYCFADYDNKWLGDAAAYMDWQCRYYEQEETLGLDKETYDTMLENIKWLQDNATLMTEDELAEYLEADYEEHPKF